MFCRYEKGMDRVRIMKFGIAKSISKYVKNEKNQAVIKYLAYLGTTLVLAPYITFWFSQHLDDSRQQTLIANKVLEARQEIVDNFGKYGFVVKESVRLIVNEAKQANPLDNQTCKKIRDKHYLDMQVRQWVSNTSALPYFFPTLLGEAKEITKYIEKNSTNCFKNTSAPDTHIENKIYETKSKMWSITYPKRYIHY